MFDTNKKRIIIAIDGMAGAGKTTIAERLARLCDANVVHTDDFHIPFKLRTPNRLAEPGGNLHYEKMLKEVILPLQEGKQLNFRPYDCKTGLMAAPRIFDDKILTIVEGTYSMHPKFGKYWDLAIFFDISPEEQLRRLSLRNGEKLSDFTDKWIPMETKYFEAFGIKEKADYTWTEFQKLVKL